MDRPSTSLEPGAAGDAVLDVQVRLAALGYGVARSERGRFGPQTESAVKAFQVRRGFTPSGHVDDATWRELVEAGRRLGSRTLYRRLPYMRGDDVRELQSRLNALGFDAGTEDGIYGRATYEAVLEFQRNIGLPVDGFVGRDTVRALDRLSRAIRPGSKAQLRQRLTRDLGSVDDRVVYLDPGHGGHDFGLVTSAGIPESYLVFRVAELASAALARQGVRAILSRAVQQGPDVARRASVANEARADVALSLHLSCRPEPGPSVAFYACDGKHSQLGRELAQCVSAGLRSQLDRAAPALGRNLEFLRQTAMPAIMVDLSGPDDDALFGEDPYLAGLADTLAAGVRDYFAAVVA